MRESNKEEMTSELILIQSHLDGKRRCTLERGKRERRLTRSRKERKERKKKTRENGRG